MLFLSAAVLPVMPRGEEIQERIQTVMEKEKAVHERQHLANANQLFGVREDRGHVQHAENQGEKADCQEDGDYSNEKLINSDLLAGHFSSFEPSNKQQVEAQQGRMAEDYIYDVDQLEIR